MGVLGTYNGLLGVSIVICLEFIHAVVLTNHIHHLGKSVFIYAR